MFASARDDDLAPFLRGAVLPPGRFLGEGPYAVKRMLDLGLVELLVGPRDRLATLDIPAGTRVLSATHDQVSAVHGARYHTGLMAVGRTPTWKELPPGLWLALDGLKDAENVGAIFRTCAAMGVDGVAYSGTCCSPWNRRCVRVSMGAVMVVPSMEVENLPGFLAGRKAYAAHPQAGAAAPWEVDWAGECVLVMGAEDTGHRPEVLRACSAAVCIPMAGGWDSLNVGAAAAVLLHEARRTRMLSPRA